MFSTPDVPFKKHTTCLETLSAPVNDAVSLKQQRAGGSILQCDKLVESNMKIC